jgi:hypothetical protein
MYTFPYIAGHGMYPFPYIAAHLVGRTFSSLHLSVSFNKSISWQHGSKAVRGEGLHGIKVALLRTESRMRTTEVQGGRQHALDTIDHRISYNPFGCHLLFIDLVHQTFPWVNGTLPLLS